MAAAKVSPPEAQVLLQEGGHAYLDVRTEEEYAAGHVPGAVNVPVFVKSDGGMAANPTFLEGVTAAFPERGEPLVVGCQAGKRSEAAVAIMEQAGYTNLADLTTGFGGWAQSGLPTQK